MRALFGLLVHDGVSGPQPLSVAARWLGCAWLLCHRVHTSRGLSRRVKFPGAGPEAHRGGVMQFDRVARLVLTLGLLAMTMAAVAGQSPEGKVRGQVFDGSDEVVPGVTVEALVGAQ